MQIVCLTETHQFPYYFGRVTLSKRIVRIGQYKRSDSRRVWSRIVGVFDSCHHTKVHRSIKCWCMDCLYVYICVDPEVRAKTLFEARLVAISKPERTCYSSLQPLTAVLTPVRPGYQHTVPVVTDTTQEGVERISSAGHCDDVARVNRDRWMEIGIEKVCKGFKKFGIATETRGIRKMLPRKQLVSQYEAFMSPVSPLASSSLQSHLWQSREAHPGAGGSRQWRDQLEAAHLSKTYCVFQQPSGVLRATSVACASRHLWTAAA